MANPYNLKIDDKVFFPELNQMGEWSPNGRYLLINHPYTVDNMGNYNFRIPNDLSPTTISIPAKNGWQPADAVLPIRLLGEVGKWYKFKAYTSDNDTVTYGKFKEISLSYLQCTEWFRSDNSEMVHTNGTWHLHIEMSLELVTQEELNKILPAEHKDRLKITPEFQVGKWYKFNNWYIKFKENANGIFIGSEEINNHREYRKCRSQFRSCNYKQVLLEDLSEIQEYLPDGHPDKVVPELWSVGNYVVYIQDVNGISKGTITRITEKEGIYISTENDTSIGIESSYCSTNLRCFKTWEEAAHYCKINFLTVLFTSSETNLEKAKRLYPIGTKIIPIDENGDSYSKPILTEKLPSEFASGNIDASNQGYIYLVHKDQWAEIVKEEPDEVCDDCNGTGKTMEAKLYPSGHTEVTIDCPTCDGQGLKSSHYTPALGDWVYVENDGGSGAFGAKGFVGRVIELNFSTKKDPTASYHGDTLNNGLVIKRENIIWVLHPDAVVRKANSDEILEELPTKSTLTIVRRTTPFKIWLDTPAKREAFLAVYGDDLCSREHSAYFWDGSFLSHQYSTPIYFRTHPNPITTLIELGIDDASTSVFDNTAINIQIEQVKTPNFMPGSITADEIQILPF